MNAQAKVLPCILHVNQLDMREETAWMRVSAT